MWRTFIYLNPYCVHSAGYGRKTKQYFIGLQKWFKIWKIKMKCITSRMSNVEGCCKWFSEEFCKPNKRPTPLVCQGSTKPKWLAKLRMSFIFVTLMIDSQLKSCILKLRASSAWVFGLVTGQHTQTGCDLCYLLPHRITYIRCCFLQAAGYATMR